MVTTQHAMAASICPTFSYPPPSPKPSSSKRHFCIPSDTKLKPHSNSTTFTTCCSQQSQGQFAFSDAADPFSFDIDEAETPAPMPPTPGRYEILIDNDIISRLDLSPFHAATGITSAPESVRAKEFLERTIGFRIEYRREDERDPRELSEYPDIRLWFLRLDSLYPWLPVVLDWRAGELVRYAAMLVPHQMSMRKGIVFNPEALELFVVGKAFVVYSWLKEHGVLRPRLKVKDMARMLGYGIDDQLFDWVDNDNTPY